MKQTLKLSVLVLAFFASINVFANDNTKDPITVTSGIDAASIIVEHNDKVYVVFENPELQAIHIEVRDGLDRLVFKETLTDKASISKVFNFTKAYTGTYTITVNDGVNRYYKSVEI